jgi:uncharacterized protein (DUF1810 family)
MATEPFDLERFVAAQDPVWPQVLQELAAGAKRSHWMWFVFPQLRGLGRSPTAHHYGIESLAEAKAYLVHPVLGGRLRSVCDLLLGLRTGSAADIFGSVDAMKLRSCLTLFERAAPLEARFGTLLERHFAGLRDPATLAMLGAH